MPNVYNILDTPPSSGGPIKSAVYEYSFAIDGGAIGTIAMRLISGDAIPANAVIARVITDVLQTFTSTGGTGQTAFQIESANDLGTASASTFTVGKVTQIDNLTYTYSNNVGLIAGALNSAIKTSTPRSPSLVQSVSALTGGRMRMAVDYVVLA